MLFLSLIVAVDEADSSLNLMADLNGSANNNEEASSDTTSEEDSNLQLIDPEPITPISTILPVKENKAPTTSKPSKPIPVPSNPLEAAMFKQMFPEEPKKVVKKSLAAMQAEAGGSRVPPTSPPAISRRDSSTENGAAGK